MSTNTNHVGLHRMTEKELAAYEEDVAQRFLRLADAVKATGGDTKELRVRLNRALDEYERLSAGSIDMEDRQQAAEKLDRAAQDVQSQLDKLQRVVDSHDRAFGLIGVVEENGQLVLSEGGVLAGSVRTQQHLYGADGRSGWVSVVEQRLHTLETRRKVRMPTLPTLPTRRNKKGRTSSAVRAKMSPVMFIVTAMVLSGALFWALSALGIQIFGIIGGALFGGFVAVLIEATRAAREQRTNASNPQS